MELSSFILKRLILMVVVIFGVLVIVFVVTRIIPADPVGAILGGNAPPAAVDEMRHQLGLDKPIFSQLLDYLEGVLRGNFGNFWVCNRPRHIRYSMGVSSRTPSSSPYPQFCGIQVWERSGGFL